MLIDRSNEQGYPGTEFRPGTLPSPLSQSAAISTHPSAVMVQWQQAYYNPSYGKTSRPAPQQDAYLRELQTGPFWAIVSSSERAMKRWFPEGSWTVGDIALTYDASQMDLSIYDWVVPMGAGTSNPGVTDAPTFQYKELVTRAATAATLAGTVTTAATLVTGTGTSFTTDFIAGDILVLGGAQFVVDTITDNTHLTLLSAPLHNWQNAAYQRGFDRVIMSPIASVVQVRDASTIYTDADFVVAGDAGGINWVNPLRQPAPGSAYSLSYRYYPTYQVTEYGTKGRVVDGRSELSVVLCTLLRPDTQTR